MLPPILVELIGDESKLTASLGKVSKNLDKLSKDGATTSEKLKAAAGPIAGAFGVAASAAGAALEHLSGQSEKAHAELEQAITNSGHDFADYSGQIDATVSHMERFGHSGADTQEALAKLTTALGDPKKALDEMSLAADYAAMKHVSLADAAGVLAKASAGSGKAFKEFGIDIKTAGDGTAAMAAAMTPAEVKAAHVAAAMGELAQKIHGQAEAAAHTFSGELSSLRAHLTDIAAGVGEKVVPALTIMGPLLMGIASVAKLEATPALLSMASAAAAVVAPLALVAAAGYAITQAFHDHAKAINASGAALKSMTQTDMQDYIAKVEEAHKANSDLFKPSDFQKDFNSALSDSVQTAQMFVDALAASGHNVDTYNEQLARANQSQGFNNQLKAEGVPVTVDLTKATNDLKAAQDDINKLIAENTRLRDAQMKAEESLIGSSESLKRATQDEADKVQTLNEKYQAMASAKGKDATANKEYQTAMSDAIGSIDAEAQAAQRLADTQASASGKTLTAAESHKIYLDKLQAVTDALQPGSGLRVAMQEYIDKMKAMEPAAKESGDAQVLASSAATGAAQTHIDKLVDLAAQMEPGSRLQKAAQAEIDRLYAIRDAANAAAGAVAHVGGVNATTGKTVSSSLTQGALASGGPAEAGNTYLVGEQGPEILHMGATSGVVIPNNQLGSSTAAPVEVTLMLDGSVLARVLTPHLRNVQRALS